MASSLEKITLVKGTTVSLEKATDKALADIQVNLKWDAAATASDAAPVEHKGLFSRLFGGSAPERTDDTSKGIDLDLGCLYELADGSKGCVQALGKSFGSLDDKPWIQLMGDDRTGESADGEFMHIRGSAWPKIKRVLVYSFIYSGIPSWDRANGSIILTTKDQPTLEVLMDEHDPTLTMCAVALLKNVNGSVSVSKEVRYFKSHHELDQAYGWGLSWVRGSKD